MHSFCNVCEPGSNHRRFLEYGHILECSCDPVYIALKSKIIDGDGLFSMLPNSSSVFTNNFLVSWQYFFRVLTRENCTYAPDNALETIERLMRRIPRAYYDVENETYTIEMFKYNIYWFTDQFKLNAKEDPVDDLIFIRISKQDLEQRPIIRNYKIIDATPEETQKMTMNPLLSYFPKKELRNKDDCRQLWSRYLLKDIVHDILNFF